ncbi:MAG: hypothetical protein KDK03_07455 [Rhodobacteraceae bacterium]|nr:hypothetical protein [Paracoccaceae bacterium]
MAEYFATTNATQRTKTIRAAKFPKKVEVASYTQIRKPLREALSQPDFGRDQLNFLADRLEDKGRRESGYNRDEALRCLRAVRAFQETFNPKSFSRITISPNPRPIFTKVEGVKLNVSLDAQTTATKDDVTNSGGIVLLYAFSADRGSLKERLATTAGLILWALEGGQMEPLPRLCMAADLAGREIIKASASHSRFRERVAESCKEIAARWDDVEPPSDYDGPDWR